MDPLKSQLYGRSDIIRDITEGVLADQPGSFSLVGTKLIGKSFLLGYLAAPYGSLRGPEYANWRPPRFKDGGNVTVVKIDCDWAEAQDDLLTYLYEQAFEQIREKESLALDEARILAQHSPTLRLWQIARQLNDRRYRLVMLLDNFDRVFERQIIHSDAVDELRPLTLEMALVVATEQPLHDLDRELAASPLFNVMTQIFVGLIDVEAANEWLDAYCLEFPALESMRGELLELTGTHPYLLRRISEIIPEIRKILTPNQELGPDHSALVRLRLAEHGRLLFSMLERKLRQPPDRLREDVVDSMIGQLLCGPIRIEEMNREERIVLNWMINQAMMLCGRHGYRFFSPLFTEFLSDRLEFAPTDAAPRRAQVADASGQDDDPIYRQLTKTESALLRYFRAHARDIVTPQQLLDDVWNRPNATSRRVQEAIRRLRLQLEDAHPPVGIIENERGRGYRFVPAGEL
ncbi:MAG: winged helix-turn-helix domain-containing protein [Caldilineaceae bacterium]|nr:winged helix-turn-helix domain-containing protein [Caldilineaceae bacterium]